MPSAMTAPSGEPTGRVGLVATAALLGGGQYGFVLAIIAGAEPFLIERFSLTGAQLGRVVSNLDLGAAAGALLAGPLSDALGRRKLLLALAAIFLLSAIVTSLANSVVVLLAGRVLAGLAVGGAMIVPLYVAEIAPARTRGLLVSLVQIGIVTGILVAFLTGWLLVDQGEANWRWMFATGILPALLLLVVMARLPESPRWLARRDASIADHGSAKTITPGTRPGQLSEGEAESPEGENWGELLRPGLRRALGVGVLLAILSVSVGINAVILYGPVILMQGAGDDVAQALLGGVALGGVNFLFSLVAMVSIDRLGRRPLLLGGLIGMGAAMLILGLRFGNGPDQPSAGLLAPILAFVAFYAVSLGPVSWVVISEIFPTSARGAGMALCMVVMYLADFAVTRLFPWMMHYLGSGAFQVFTAICAVGMLLVLAWVPETKGKTLEQIQASWAQR